MPIINKDIIIKAPPEALFNYTSKPDKPNPDLAGIGGAEEHADRCPNGGFSFQWVYKMSGTNFSGLSRVRRHNAVSIGSLPE
jgi:hypothetical protein